MKLIPAHIVQAYRLERQLGEMARQSDDTCRYCLQPFADHRDAAEVMDHTERFVAIQKGAIGR